CDIVRRGNEYARHGPKLPRHKGGNCESAEAECYVHTLIDEIGNVIVEDQLDRQIRMAAMEVHDQGSKISMTQASRCLYAQVSPEFGREIEDIVFDLGDLVQDLPSPGQVRLPRRRQCQLPRATIEQPGPQMTLEPRDLLAYGGLGQAELASGR